MSIYTQLRLKRSKFFNYSYEVELDMKREKKQEEISYQLKKTSIYHRKNKYSQVKAPLLKINP